MPAKIIWNDDLDAALRDLVASDANREACSDAMGISWPCMRKRMRELGIAKTPSRHPRAATVRALALISEGRSLSEAARISGALYNTVYRADRRTRARG